MSEVVQRLRSFLTKSPSMVYPDEVLELFEPVEAENAKLREQIVQLQADWESERDYANQMEAKEKRAVAENDKLRELIRAAWRCIHTGPDCYDCRLIAGGCTLQSAMRELGIEVQA